eukprot:Tbor_TRINITY_DN6094_c2_g2::TRINITY_DN6094_c2_g2_i10::g.10812::m.10812
MYNTQKIKSQVTDTGRIPIAEHTEHDICRVTSSCDITLFMVRRQRRLMVKTFICPCVHVLITQRDNGYGSYMALLDPTYSPLRIGANPRITVASAQVIPCGLQMLLAIIAVCYGLQQDVRILIGHPHKGLLNHVSVFAEEGKAPELYFL